MQFHLSTEYAMRILNYLGSKKGALSSAEELAESLGITHLYLMKIMRPLKNANLIVSVQGRHGGYRAACPLEKISVYDIVCAIEGNVCISPCMKEGYQIKSKTAEQHSGQEFFRSMQEHIVDILKDTRLSDIAAANA